VLNVGVVEVRKVRRENVGLDRNIPPWKDAVRSARVVGGGVCGKGGERGSWQNLSKEAGVEGDSLEVRAALVKLELEVRTCCPGNAPGFGSTSTQPRQHIKDANDFLNDARA
jgi:hypothetical protein